jgi:DNA modification methylase
VPGCPRCGADTYGTTIFFGTGGNPSSKLIFFGECMSEVKPFYQDQLATVYNGDALTILKDLPDECIQMCMTSPPYWGLRNYADGANIIWGDNHCDHEWGADISRVDRGAAKGKTALVGNQLKEISGVSTPQGNFCLKCEAWRGQLGLEPTPELYVEHLMMIFREVKRVLKGDGSFYLNIGDTYVSGKGSCFNPGGGSKSWQSWNDRKVNYPTGRDAPNRMCKTIPPKCMACIPERVLFAMLNDGWILRNKVIWHKRNHMPGSQKDRFTQSWEYLYFFTKSRKYYFDLDAVRVTHLSIKGSGNKERKIPFSHKGNLGHSIPWQPTQEITEKMPRHHGSGPQYKLSGLERGNKHHGSSMNNQARLHRGRGYNSKYLTTDYGQPLQGFQRDQTIIKARDESRERAKELFPDDPQKQQEYINFIHDHQTHPKGKNPGDLWSISTRPSAISVCPQCETVFPRLLKVCPHCKLEGIIGHFAPYPEALCTAPIKASSRVGDIVIDPFAGGGTTGVAAKRLGRWAILIDCVRPYCIMAKYKLVRIEYQPEFQRKDMELQI